MMNLYFYGKEEKNQCKVLARIQNICYNGYAQKPFRLHGNSTQVLG